VRIIRAGLVEYTEAWDLQRKIHAAVVAGEQPDTTLLLEHPPVFTAGKRTEDWERPVIGGPPGSEGVAAGGGTPVIDVDRGGKITWHGPGQLVGYPILKLADPIDVVAYVRRMEGVLIDVCADLGLATGRVEGRSGVWVTDSPGSRKVAAIGIRVAQGVTLHGFAINCNPDLSWFSRIVACGITDASVTSISAELGRDVTVEDVLPLVEKHLPALHPTAPRLVETPAGA
jgi:lipoyl(octanoyl) transferase